MVPCEYDKEYQRFVLTEIRVETNNRLLSVLSVTE